MNEELLAESLGVTYTREQRRGKLQKPEWLYWVVVVTLVVLFRLFFNVVAVNGTSMMPTLQSGQFTLATNLVQPTRGDIVVLNERIEDNGDTTVVIKRLIGLPGDQIDLIKGELFVNGEKVDEPYISESPLFRQSSFVTVVPEGYYFVMGDNRDNSRDSRIVGNYKQSSLIGKVIWR